MDATFQYCFALTGEIVIHANPQSYAWCFFYTSLPITLKGDSASLAKLAATTTPNTHITVE